MSRESSTKVEESQEHLAEALRKKDLAETAKKKAEMELRKLKVSITLYIQCKSLSYTGLHFRLLVKPASCPLKI